MLNLPNGVTWTNRTASSGTTNLLTGITFGKGLFVATGEFGTILTSPNGTNWTAINPAPTTELLYALDYDGENFTAVGTAVSLFTSEKRDLLDATAFSHGQRSFFSGLQPRHSCGRRVGRNGDQFFGWFDVGDSEFRVILSLNWVTSGKINIFLAFGTGNNFVRVDGPANAFKVTWCKFRRDQLVFRGR